MTRQAVKPEALAIFAMSLIVSVGLILMGLVYGPLQLPDQTSRNSEGVPSLPTSTPLPTHIPIPDEYNTPYPADLRQLNLRDGAYIPIPDDVEVTRSTMYPCRTCAPEPWYILGRYILGRADPYIIFVDFDGRVMEDMIILEPDTLEAFEFLNDIQTKR